eukprot:8560846-Lingulodinium_polyedra.AAC.1
MSQKRRKRRKQFAEVRQLCGERVAHRVATAPCLYRERAAQSIPTAWLLSVTVTRLAQRVANH